MRMKVNQPLWHLCFKPKYLMMRCCDLERRNLRKIKVFPVWRIQYSNHKQMVFKGQILNLTFIYEAARGDHISSAGPSTHRTEETSSSISGATSASKNSSGSRAEHKKKKRKDFIKRNMEVSPSSRHYPFKCFADGCIIDSYFFFQLAADAASTIAMTDDEKKRIEDLLGDLDTLPEIPEDLPSVKSRVSWLIVCELALASWLSLWLSLTFAFRTTHPTLTKSLCPPMRVSTLLLMRSNAWMPLMRDWRLCFLLKTLNQFAAHPALWPSQTRFVHVWAAFCKSSVSHFWACSGADGVSSWTHFICFISFQMKVVHLETPCSKKVSLLHSRAKQS